VQQPTFLGPGSAECRDAPSPTLHELAKAPVRPLAVTTCDLADPPKQLLISRGD
jgi:hypothetical protein